jgi:S1-C subfamily serine protease
MRTTTQLSLASSPRRRAGLAMAALAVAFTAIPGMAGAQGQPPVTRRAITPRGDLMPHERAVIELFRRSKPSVAFITTLSRELDLNSLDFTEAKRGTGSGFVWDTRGHVVTNYHVVQGASGARVTLADQKTYPAQLVGVAPAYDLAVLRIRAPASRLRALPLGTSQDLQVGQMVLAIGNPFGLDHTLTRGIVSALGRTFRTRQGVLEQMIQTDAAINPGNSGGPLLDSAGRLIGVNTAIFSPSGSSAGIGFAVPVDLVNRVVPELIVRGRLARADVGVRLNQHIGQRITEELGVTGALVLGVVTGSAAAKAGVRGTRRSADGYIVPGDVITKLDDQPITSAEEVQSLLGRRHPGDTITLTLLKPGGGTRIVKLQATEASDRPE